ncbi:hypothetical protein [Nocardiopsis suaedae]|uniref:Uncharacterized protein n=1 Tax=Nocardiopsis suaedae TaxID=3018444 RepID=A0ABT4TPC6_9ACTN|nr:hypothetical protein [Nocardiopsis suaedae]MDA2806240.1 hypothetical protein [Nocardiopsis suaedae]
MAPMQRKAHLIGIAIPVGEFAPWRLEVGNEYGVDPTGASAKAQSTRSAAEGMQGLKAAFVAAMEDAEEAVGKNPGVGGYADYSEGQEKEMLNVEEHSLGAADDVDGANYEVTGADEESAEGYQASGMSLSRGISAY